MTKHTFIFQRKQFTLLPEIPLSPFLESSSLHAVYELVCSSVTDRPLMEKVLDDPTVDTETLDSIADWITEIVSERKIEVAIYIWTWGRINLQYVEGRLLLAGRDLDSLTARRFFAVAYTLMAEEHGGRGALEGRLEELVTESQMFTAARESGGETTDPVWDQADKLAIELLSEAVS